MRFYSRLFSAAVALALATCSTLQAVDANLPDDFEDGTVQAWENGTEVSSVGITNIASGGPDGVNDNYLEVQSGPGFRPRLVTFNDTTKWLGDYLAAGVTAIEMDLKNFGAGPLSMRIALLDDFLPGDSAGYVSTTPFSLANDGNWHHVSFSLDAADLTAFSDPGTLADVLSDPLQVRILHSTTASTNGNALTAQIGIDNIVAFAPLIGDFDDDLDVDADDIDILADIVLRGASDPGGDDDPDLDGNSTVEQDDMDYMISTVLETVYGDTDLDDDVDGDDFDAWRIRDSLGGGIGWATGDWDGDNDFDGADFDHWRLRLPSIGGAGGAAAVPEPGSLILVGVALPALCLVALGRKIRAQY